MCIIHNKTHKQTKKPINLHRGETKQSACLLVHKLTWRRKLTSAEVFDCCKRLDYSYLNFFFRAAFVSRFCGGMSEQDT